MAATAPAVGRPAQGFSTERAQRWVLAAAIICATIYSFRRLVEPARTTPANGSKAARIAGAGSPPPDLEQWAISYGVGFVLLSLMTLGAPEVAASLAMLMVTGTILTNGTTIVADILDLQAGGKTSSAVGSSLPSAIVQGATTAGATAGSSAAGVAGTAGAAGAGVLAGATDVVHPNVLTGTSINVSGL